MAQQLHSAKYLQPDPTVESPLPSSLEPTSPGALGLDQVYRTATRAVLATVVMFGATMLWLNRESLREGARTARRRTENPVNFLFWLGGSDKTLEDAIIESGSQYAGMDETAKGVADDV